MLYFMRLEDGWGCSWLRIFRKTDRPHSQKQGTSQISQAADRRRKKPGKRINSEWRFHRREEKNEKDRFVGGLFATRDAGVIRSFLNALHFSTLADMVGSSLLSPCLAASKEALLEFFRFYVCSSMPVFMALIHHF